VTVRLLAALLALAAGIAAILIVLDLLQSVPGSQ
jgi:hypothetical protein